MTQTNSHEPVDALLAEYLEARRSGKRTESDTLLRDHPELAAEVAEFIDDYEQLDRRFAPLRSLADSTPCGAADVPTLVGNDTAVPSPHKAGTSFGDYELLAEVARGGMGVVYRARQKSLNRIVALKMVLGERGNATDRDRFLVEARAVARLNHPHIVPIYEVGEHAGQPYFTMEFFSGGSLGEKSESLRGDQRAIARMMVTVARAVEHAHRRGILHRDIKPNNVLLDERGEPHVTDFGLAKQLDEQSDLTQAGAIVGTPSYMAPEQVQAQTDLTTAVDVYGLGALMYELLTGRPPFRGNTPLETLMAAVSDPPQRPRRLRADVSADLETICLKCLEKDPLARYASADALADDLDRWLAGKPILARPVTATERLVKWSRRQPLLAGSLATVFVAALALLILAGFLWQNAEARAQAVKDLGQAKTELAQVDGERRQAEAKKSEAEKLADEQRQIADQQKALADKISLEVRKLQKAAENAQQKLEVAERDARRTLYAADVQLAHAAWQSDNIPTLSELLERHRPGSHVRQNVVAEPSPHALASVATNSVGQEDLRGFEWHYLNRQLHGARLSWHAKADEGSGFDTIWGMAVSPDGKLLATVQPGNVLKLWNLADGKLLRVVSPLTKDKNGTPQSNLAGVFFADEGRQLVAVARKDFEMAAFQQLVAEAIGGKGKFNFESLIDSLEFRSWTLADESPARVEPFDPRRLEAPLSTIFVGGIFAAEEDRVMNVMALDRSPDSKFLALAGAETRVAAIASGDPRSAGRVQSGRLIIWDLEKGQIHAQQNSPVVLTTVAFSPDGTSLATSTGDGAVGIGKSDLSQPPRLMLGHHGLVYSLRFSADGSRLASGGMDASAIIWDVAEAKEVDRLRGHLATVTHVAWTADGRTVATGGGDGVVKVWDLSRASRPVLLRGHESIVSALAFNKDGSELIAAESGGAAKIWSMTDGTLVRELPVPKAATGGLVFISPSGKTLTWPSWNFGDNRITLRSITEGAERQIAWKEHAPLQSAISADERLLASADQQSGRIGIWNLADLAMLKELEGAKFIAGLAFSNDGKLLAQRGHGVVLWDVEAGTSRRILDASESTSAMVFSADNKLLAAASNKRDIRIWDLQADRICSEFHPAGEAIMHLAFSPDGRRLATNSMISGQLGVLKLWDTTTGREVFTASLPPVRITAIAFSPNGHRLAAATTTVDITASLTGRKVPCDIYLWDATPVAE